MTGGELRTVRKELGFTQMLMASAMGVSVSTVQSWERGRDKKLWNPIGVAVTLIREKTLGLGVFGDNADEDGVGT